VIDPLPTSGEKEQLANRLLDAIAFDERLRRPFEQLARERETSAAVHAPTRKRLDALLEFRQRVITPELVRPTVVARYTATFSEHELRDLVAFYESPLGQKFVRCWTGDDSELKRVMTQATAARSAELDELLEQADSDSERI
jgi:hypothetical protein